MTYTTRLTKVQNALNEKNIDGILIQHPLMLFYMTGLELSAGQLLIGKTKAHLIVDGRYFESCQKKSPFPVTLMDSDALKKVMNTPAMRSINRLGFDSTDTSHAAYLQMRTSLRGLPRKMSYKPLPRFHMDVRAVKDKKELTIIKKAGKLCVEGYQFALQQLEEGITEVEVANRLEIFWKQNGGDCLSFDPIIAFGANSSMPHYRPKKRKLRQGDTVLMDMGVTLNGYASDMTRVTFFGEPKKKVEQIYWVVYDAYQAAEELCQPGVTPAQLDQAARAVIADAGYGECFPHGLGHGVGLDVHESPIVNGRSKIPLEEGMVITIEPGIYIPNVGGVRLENSVIVTKNGCEVINKCGMDLLVIE